MAKILDGKLLAQEMQNEIREIIKTKKICPRLDVFLVGDNPASEIYVSKKREACEYVGISTATHTFAETDEDGVKQQIKVLNESPLVNAILVQLPLPKSFDSNNIFDLISGEKDVDVFNPVNIGLLVQNRPRFLPPTPSAVRELIYRNNIPLKGKHVVVINRSLVIGKPLSSMLIQDNILANATVTICHDNTPFDILKQICLSADIIVVGVGIPNFLTADMVKSHQAIIDVGITRIGKKVVGDVCDEVNNKVAWISKVPGGVGPATISFLLKNTLQAYFLQNKMVTSPTI